jgi:hypothetical protein
MQRCVWALHNTADKFGVSGTTSNNYFFNNNSTNHLRITISQWIHRRHLSSTSLFRSLTLGHNYTYNNRWLLRWKAKFFDISSIRKRNKRNIYGVQIQYSKKCEEGRPTPAYSPVRDRRRLTVLFETHWAQRVQAPMSQISGPNLQENHTSPKWDNLAEDFLFDSIRKGRVYT